MAAVAVLLQPPPMWPALFRSFALHPGGVVYRRFRSSETVLFDRVDEVWMDALPGAGPGPAALWLRQHDGKVHALDLQWLSRNDSKTLVGAVLRECSDALLAGAEEALAAGEVLRFGHVAINANGIEAATVNAFGIRGSRRLLWTELRFARLKNNCFQLCGQDDYPLMVRVDQVPRPTLLMALLRSLAPWPDDPP